VNRASTARLQPNAQPAAQNIVANGLAFDEDGRLFVADTARGALWRVAFNRRGDVRTPTGCDATYPENTLCLDALFVQHPAIGAGTWRSSPATP
jgi:hypothetical protein